MKKFIILLCIGFFGIVLIALLPTEVTEINNAAVNPYNGDVAFAYLDYDQGATVSRIEVYDKFGNKLYSKSFLASGGTHLMLFCEDELCVVIGRTNDMYSYDRNGNEIKASLSIEEVKERMAFDEWDASYNKRVYSLNEYVYCYEKPSIFKHKARLSIKCGENVKILYQSP